MRRDEYGFLIGRGDVVVVCWVGGMFTPSAPTTTVAIVFAVNIHLDWSKLTD
jgi:hypothetical protein